MRVPKNTPKSLPVATAVKRIAKKGTPTPKRKKKPIQPRYVQTIVRLSIEDYERGLPYFEARENLSKFAIEAVREKINRAEANDKAGRLRKLLTDEDLLFAVLKHMKETGKLNFLFR